MGWIRLEPEQKFGTRQDELQRRFDAAVEVRVVGAPATIKLHQCGKRRVVQRFAIRHAPKRRKNFCGARRLIFSRWRPADEDLAPGSRIAGAGLSERAFYRD